VLDLSEIISNSQQDFGGFVNQQIHCLYPLARNTCPGVPFEEHPLLGLI
jgi:hypothetical protein